jgi:parallel beta-helix repeat protein
MTTLIPKYDEGSTGAINRPINLKLAESISVLDFGADPTGLTDSRAAINAATLSLSTSGGALHFPSGIYLITDAVTLYSNIVCYGDGASSIVRCATTGKSFFAAANKSNITISNIQFEQTITGTAAYVGAVALDTCDRVTIDNCNFIGMQWAGVWLKDSNYCKVTNNRFTAFNGTVQDSADVCIYRNSSYNIITNNYFYAGCDHGVLIQDPYDTTLPLKNIIDGNRIGQHRAYGVAVYQPNAINTYAQITNNFIENILGSVTGNSSGAGIYIVGAGGVVIEGNTIRNCCQQTNNRSLTPGAIGINGINIGLAPVVISNNNIADTNYYDCINISSSSAGAIINSNQMTMNLGNSTGFPVYINAASNVTVNANSITQNTNLGRGIYIYANDADIGNHIITNNNIKGGNTSQIETYCEAGYFITNAIISNNLLTECSSSGNPLKFGTNSRTFVVTGNYAKADTQVAVYQSNSTNFRYANNFFFTTGTNPIQFVGTNTGTYFDKTNTQSNSLGSASQVLNQGTGAIVEIQGNAAPTTGTWAVGDAVWQNVPVVGQPKGWRCTVAGTAGTWVSEGNL